MPGRHLTLFLLCLAAAPRPWCAVVINEVGFDEPGGDWVELYNSGPAPESVNGWRLDDGDTAANNEILLAFPASIPAGAFLLIYVDASGPDDTDFSDGLGVYFTGTATTVNLASTEDELGLYSGVLSSATLVDFLAWDTQPPYGGAADQNHAAGQWPMGEAVVLTDLGQGYSVGRALDGQDADLPADFRLFPRGTPGASNVAPVSPFAEYLRADPRAFSPFDADPAFQATRLYFRAAGPEAVKTIKVLDSRGWTVRTLVDQDRGSAGDISGLASGSVLWDGRDDAGVLAPVGVYVVTLEASSPGGSTARARVLVAVGRRQ